MILRTRIIAQLAVVCGAVFCLGGAVSRLAPPKQPMTSFKSPRIAAIWSALQKMNFTPNCICRGVLTVLRIVPKSWLNRLAFGWPYDG